MAFAENIELERAAAFVRSPTIKLGTTAFRRQWLILIGVHSILKG